MEFNIFLSVLARRITTYLLNNKYIDISVQKGRVPGVAGCVEHTTVRGEIIRDARGNKDYFAVLWLDLANAHGSTPHKVIDTTFEIYHVSLQIRALLQDYFDRIEIRLSVDNFVTNGKGWK